MKTEDSSIFNVKRGRSHGYTGLFKTKLWTPQCPKCPARCVDGAGYSHCNQGKEAKRLVRGSFEPKCKLKTGKR
jgi:hypothetical protein